MKLRNEIIEKTSLEQSTLMDRILLLLNKRGYRIVDQGDNYIEFDNYAWKFKSRGEMFSKLAEGRFKISRLDGVTTIQLVYYITYLSEIVIMVGLILCAIFINYCIFIFPVIILLQFLIKIDSLKKVGIGIVFDILDLN